MLREHSPSRPWSPQYQHLSPLLTVVSKQTQASAAPPWSLEGGSSGTEGWFSPLPRTQQHNWATETTATAHWQPGQWPIQWPFWNAWGVPVMAMQPLLHSSAAASEQQLSALMAPGSVQEAHPEVKAEEVVTPLLSRLPHEGGGQGPPACGTVLAFVLR